MYPAGTSLQRTRFMFAKDIKYTTYVIVAHTVLFFFFYSLLWLSFFRKFAKHKNKGTRFLLFLVSCNRALLENL